jgi:hypothetical protein
VNVENTGAVGEMPERCIRDRFFSAQEKRANSGVPPMKESELD